MQPVFSITHNPGPGFRIALTTALLLLLMSVSVLQAQAGQVAVKKGLQIPMRTSLPDALADPQNWPSTAPRNLAELMQTGFPDPALCCDLETTGLANQKKKGPDGGQVSIYQNPANYTWQMQNGIKIWSAPGSLMTLTYGDHKVWSYRMQGRKGNWNRRAIWQFPDQSRLVRYYNPALQRYIYEYENLPAKQVYNFFVLPDLLPASKIADGFAFHYKASYGHVVDMYLASKQRKAYQAFLQANWNIPDGVNIPFLIFENVKEYNDYLQEKNEAQAGGRGYDGLVLLCCGADWGAAPTSEAELQARLVQNNFALLMHELTHNRMKQACFGFADYNVRPEVYPGRVFSEGMAEWAVTKINTYYRDFLLKKALQLHKSQRWSYKALADTSGKYYYPLMFAFWDSLEQKKGQQSLLDYHKASCLGATNDEAAEQIWGASLANLFAAFLKDFGR
ncbi:MAG: hypothetical protein KDK39_13570 [Leptospiraceae bacterium]|nr:hypothetical protein [Leptospiraceae bacterium]